MGLMAITVLFLIPIYYIAKSKGYAAFWICAISAGIAYFAPFLYHAARGEDRLFAIDITAPLLVLVIIWLMPARKGAPGKRYLKITFECPECRATVSFPRHEEGRAILCSSCGEIITVPLDEYSTTMPRDAKHRPTQDRGMISLDTYGNEMKAVEIKSLLEGNGISATIFDGTGSGILPHLGIAEGYSVMISAQDWDRAMEIIHQDSQPRHGAYRRHAGERF